MNASDYNWIILIKGRLPQKIKARPRRSDYRAFHLPSQLSSPKEPNGYQEKTAGLV
jgi:hypothetical protein